MLQKTIQYSLHTQIRHVHSLIEIQLNETKCFLILRKLFVFRKIEKKRNWNRNWELTRRKRQWRWGRSRAWKPKGLGTTRLGRDWQSLSEPSKQNKQKWISDKIANKEIGFEKKPCENQAVFAYHRGDEDEEEGFSLCFGSRTVNSSANVELEDWVNMKPDWVPWIDLTVHSVTRHHENRATRKEYSDWR